MDCLLLSRTSWVGIGHFCSRLKSLAPFFVDKSANPAPELRTTEKKEKAFWGTNGKKVSSVWKHRFFFIAIDQKSRAALRAPTSSWRPSSLCLLSPLCFCAKVSENVWLGFTICKREHLKRIREWRLANF